MSDHILYDKNIPDYWPRERKIAQLLSIAEMMARKCKPDLGKTGLLPEDIYQIVSVAIVKAVDEYDPSRGVKLTTFAMGRANLAVKDAFRRHNHAPRSLEKAGKGVRWVCFSQLNSPAINSNEEDAFVLNMLADPSIDVESSVLDDVERSEVYAYIDRLPDRYKQAVLMHLSGIDTKEIAKTLKVCPSRVHQMIRESIKRMRGFVRFDETMSEYARPLAGMVA